MLRVLSIPAAFLLLLAAVVLWSGGGGEAPADFTFVNRGDIRTLDPNRMSWNEDIRIGYAIFEGLYALDPVDLRPVPGQADQIELSEDKTVYTFHIRPGAGWSNGDPVTAKDFEFAWRRMLEQPGGDYAYLLDYIAGAAAYRAAYAEGKPCDFKTVGIEVLGPKLLRVRLKHPVAFFPDLCSFPAYFPLNEKSMERFREVDAAGRVKWRSEFMRPPNLVSNGPFRVEKWEFKRRMRLVANEHYWDRQNVKSRIIEQVVVEDNKLGEFLRYETGAVDWLPDVDPQFAAELIARGKKDPSRPRRDLHVFPAFGTYFYSVNCEPKLKDGRDNPFRDVRVRKAFAMSIDKRRIVETITRLGEGVAEHFVPPGSLPGYESPRGIPYDVTAAKRLLAEAGYPNGQGFPVTPLTFNTSFGHSEVAQVVRRQWLDNLGVNVDLEPVEPAIFSERLYNREYAIARASWFGDYMDPSTFMDKYLSASDNNDSGWVHPEYDQLCYAAAREPDPQKRMQMLQRAEQILLDEVPIIPLYYYMNRYLIRENVKGMHLHMRNHVMFKPIHVAREE